MSGKAPDSSVPHRNPQDYSRLTEADILADIQYFRARLALLERSRQAADRSRTQVYKVLLHQRELLLTAYRDGRPEAWAEYDQRR